MPHSVVRRLKGVSSFWRATHTVWRSVRRQAAERIIGVSFGTECIVAGRGQGSTLPVVCLLQGPDHRLQVGTVDVVVAILADLPDGGRGGIVGDAVDPLHTVGGKHHHRFGDQHRSGSFGTERIIARIQAASRT
jgi:hypothetical protein